MPLEELQTSLQGERCYQEGLCCWNCERDREDPLIQGCVQNLLQEQSQRVPASQSGMSLLPVHYLSKPQFSPFFGFSDSYEAESALPAGLHSEAVIVEQICRSHQGEAKYKIVGFGPEASTSSILI